MTIYSIYPALFAVLLSPTDLSPWLTLASLNETHFADRDSLGIVISHLTDMQARQEADHLYGLPEPHLISQDATAALPIQLPQPANPYTLVAETYERDYQSDQEPICLPVLQQECSDQKKHSSTQLLFSNQMIFRWASKAAISTYLGIKNASLWATVWPQ